jgi:hypothetical protein
MGIALLGARLTPHPNPAFIIFQVIEPNEDLRLELCRTFNCLVRGILAGGAERTLDAYYADIIFAVQTSTLDPFPGSRVEACNLLVQLLRIPHWEQGSRYFATGLARSALLGCRHRNTHVIIAAISLFEASVSVPYRAKKKGAGTAAIADLVGFREENVSGARPQLPVVIYLRVHKRIVSDECKHLLGSSGCSFLRLQVRRFRQYPGRARLPY